MKTADLGGGDRVGSDRLGVSAAGPNPALMLPRRQTNKAAEQPRKSVGILANP
jgi:hypothetical protein